MVALKAHRQLHPRLIEHSLLQAKLSDKGWQITSWPAPLRLELLHKLMQTSVCTHADGVLAEHVDIHVASNA